MQSLKRGFTLIELLVVIGILAVLMAGVVTLINPLEKNRQALDAKVFSDIGQITSAIQAIAATTTDGAYPCAVAAAGCVNPVVNMSANNGVITAAATYLGSGANQSGELTAVPSAPTGATYNPYLYFQNAAGTRPLGFQVWGKLGSNKYNSQCPAAAPNAWYLFDSGIGRARIECRGAGAPAAYTAPSATNFITL